MGKDGARQTFTPVYLRLLERGLLSERAALASRRLENCDLCARYCHVNRLHTLDGVVCRTGERARVHSFGPHLGEEDPLRGSRGPGTIFFSWCNLRCEFCQNWDISRKGLGREISPNTYLNLMVQYRPCYRAGDNPPLDRPIRGREFQEALELAAKYGLHRLDRRQPHRWPGF